MAITKDERGIRHLVHYKDGQPLCWPMSRQGRFKGTINEANVTCPDCLKYMGDDG